MADLTGKDSANPLVARLARLETGLVSDVLDEAGLPNRALASTLRSVNPNGKFAGIAACASGEPSIPARNQVQGLPADTLEDLCGPDTILVVGAGGLNVGTVIGGFVAYSLMREGCRALVTDGPIRDVAEIDELGFNVLCGSFNPVNGALRWRLTQRDVPVPMPGLSGTPVMVSPGDLILADRDGAVVVPAFCAEQVIADAEELGRIERRIAEQLRAGGKRTEVMAANPRFDHVRKVARA